MPTVSDSTIPHFRVYKNAKLLSTDLYQIEDIGALNYVKILDSELTQGDRIDIKIYSKSVSQTGYYEIPKNLEFNTENKNFSTLTLGQLRNHLETTAENSNRLIGPVPGSSNVRDIPIKQQGGSIVQHASPVLYSELFLVDQKVNFMRAVDLARHEYSKIKNKLLELSQSLIGVNENDIPSTCDLILKTINQVKNKTFPWYYSDMVPYGDVKNVISRFILDAQIRDYEISEIFDDTNLSNKAVLVYVNKQQLIKDKDYKFDKTRAGVTISSDYLLNVGDSLTIIEYNNTDGNYIPETPTKLGLYPKFQPLKYLDDTYETPIYVIRGHDGSITPAFNDFRDELLLEFEKRIYNNIKVDFETNEPNLYDLIPGKFRKISYNLNEFNQLLTRSFLKWVGSNRVDFTTNSYFKSNNPFTWNYRRFTDTIDGEYLPGTWRAIFNYFYDTDTPHLTPWQMLGFSIKPDWWESRYGPAPYTGGNLVLWQDLEAGFIYAGDRAGYDINFARPGLSKIIPVDDRGLLRPPSEFAVSSINSNDTNASYAVGNQGPVETAWRRSSDYAFALQQALAVGYPAYYFGTLMNVGAYKLNKAIDQFVLTDNLQRIATNYVVLNGDATESSVKRAAGYLNWILDYLNSLGINGIAKVKDYLKFVSVQLAYKMAGYSDPTMMQVIAEQASPASTNQGVVIPPENYSMLLNKSTPTDTIVYSAVIVEKSENGYTVSGYDLENPFFTIIPSIANNNAYAISVNTERAVIYNDYQNYKVNIPYGFEFINKQQVVDFLVSYQRYLIGIGLLFNEYDTNLNEKRDFILSCKEFLNWTQQGWNIGSVVVLSPILNILQIECNSGTIDVIENSPNTSRILDTNFTFIKNSQFTVVREDTNFKLTTNYVQTIALAVLNVVEYEHAMIFDNETVFADIIYKPELGNRQYRLKLIGQKTGNWNGTLTPGGFIYNSENVEAWTAGIDYKKGSLVVYKNFYYAALLDIVATQEFNQSQWRQIPKAEIKTGLLPNFTYNAAKFNQFFDLDNPSSEGNFDDYSNRLIGFQERQYLTDFGINKSVQAKFYQGFIKEKGTYNSVTAFTAAGFNGVTGQINLYEEWGVLVGDYGATDNNKFAEVQLIEGQFTGDPVTFTLLSNNDVGSDKIISLYQNDLYKTGIDFQANIYLNRDQHSIYENDIHTAGYVSLNDVDATIFNLANYSSLYQYLPQMGIGYKLWCAKDFTGDWNVLRLTETETSVIEIFYNIDNICTVVTERATNLVYGDLIVIKGFDNRVDGIFQVYNIINPLKFSIVAVQIADQIKQIQSIKGRGQLYKFISVRIKESSDLNAIQPRRGWQDNDKLWVDTDINSGGWSVYNKSTPWSGNVSDFNPNMKMNANSYLSDSGFGSVTTLSADGSFAAAGMPTANNVGRVIGFTANTSNGNIFTMVANLTATSQNVSKFGASLESAKNILFVGAPGNGSSQSGNVFIYNFNGHSFSLSQRISSNWSPNVGDAFGESISASADGRWLFVGAPNKGNVEIFCVNNSGNYFYANTIKGSALAKFGKTIKTTTDASQTIVSAPYESINSVSSAGAIYVYDRSIETFIANTNVTFETLNKISSSTLRVFVENNLQTLNQDYIIEGNLQAITFFEAPVIGSRVDIETNKFSLLQKLTAKSVSSGAEFGISAHISGNDSEIFAASPGFSEPGYHSGIVYRFVDRGAVYGSIDNKNFNATVNIGDSIRINGQLVKFTKTDLANVAVAINSTNISGVSASVSDYGKLTISSNLVVPYERLLITPGEGTALTDIGLMVYDFVQEIRHPSYRQIDQFGSQVLSSVDSRQLVISASGGTTYNTLTFDKAKTTFDQNSTNWLDAIPGSGSVFIYALVSGDLAGDVEDQYVLVQNLENKNLNPNDLFGTGIAMNSNIMLVGAQNDSGNRIIADSNSGLLSEVPRTGTYYIYTNPDNKIGWDVIHSESPKVDINSISNSYIYDRVSQRVIERLDFIDPAKGRILGTAAQDIDFRTPYDPAVYNVAGSVDNVYSTLSFNSDYHWGASQVGKIWWNLDTVRFLDYEQGSLIYRSANWGALFPGSSIEIYEWVESQQVPSQYIGSGTPKYPDNSAYVIETYVDEVTRIVNSRYYFWVRHKTTINLNSPKTNSAERLEQLIANPASQAIPYIQILRSDTISLHGITNKITGNNTILHLGYDTLKNTNIIHSEYALIQENSNSIIPDKIVKKLKDSLSGVDEVGNSVPDPSLALQNRIGLSTKPRQSIFVDRLNAVKNFFEYVNDILITVPVTEEYNLDKLYSGEPRPDSEEYDLITDTKKDLDYIDITQLSEDYTVLVLHDESLSDVWSLYSVKDQEWQLVRYQSYYVPFYWQKTDWYDSSYDYTMKPDYVVQNISDLFKFLYLPDGTEVKVMNNGRGQFEIYRYTNNNRTLVGLQNGTIQFNSKLYDGSVDCSKEMRIIFDSIHDDIFTKSLKENFNKLFFFVINYILTEQKNVDWVFKTSFVSIVHRLKKLLQFANYIKDNQTYYESYINEVKPYRTSLREYVLDYEGDDLYASDLTDFDLPSIYVSSIEKYHSPDGSYSIDSSLLSTASVYSQWYNNHSYSIGEVLVSNPGYPKQDNVVSLFLQDNLEVKKGDIISQTQSSTTISGIVDKDSNQNIVLLSNVDIGARFDTINYIFKNSANTGVLLNSFTVLSNSGYYIAPTVSVIGGGGTGANIRAIIDYDTNTIAEFQVLNPGSGYTSTPTIQINGVGYGAAAHPVLTGQYYVETLPTYVLSLEKSISVYAGNLVVQPNTDASGTVYKTSVGNTVTLIDVVGTFRSNDYIFSESANLFCRAAAPTNKLILSGNANLYVGNILNTSTANAIVFSDAVGSKLAEYNAWVTEVLVWNLNGDFYSNTNAFRDSTDLGVQVIHTIPTGITSPINQVNLNINKNYNKVRTFNNHLKFDRISYDTQVIDWQPNITVAANTIVSYQGKGYKALQTVYSSSVLKLANTITVTAGDYITQAGQTGNARAIVSSSGNLVTVANLTGQFIARAGNILINGITSEVKPVRVTNVFDYTKYQQVNASEFDNANDRIWSFYQPTPDKLPKDLKKLVNGIAYPGVKVSGVEFAETTKIVSTNLVSTGTFISSTELELPDINRLFSSNSRQFNFVDLGFSENQPLTVINNDLEVVSLSGSVLASEGDYLIQDGKSALVHKNLSGNTFVVQSNVLTTDGSTIDVLAHYKFKGNINLSGQITAQAGNVLLQPDTAASAVVVENVFNSNTVHVTSISGTFRANSFVYLEAANTNSYFNSLNFDEYTINTTYVPTVIEPRKNNLTIQRVEPANLYVVGLQDIITSNANLTFNYYDYADPIYLDSIIQSSYGYKTYELILDNYITCAFGSKIGQLNNNVSAILRRTLTNSDRFTISNVSGIFDTLSNVTVNDQDTGIRPTAVTLITDTQSTLGVKSEDIIIEGGAYYDTFSSHAPEELVPGRVYDSLVLNVYTKMWTNSNVGYRIIQGMNSNASSINSEFQPQYYRISNSSAQLTATLNLSDSNVYVSNAQILPEPNPKAALPGTIYINGELISYYERDLANNRLSRIRRSVNGTGSPNVHTVGSKVESVSELDKIRFNSHKTSWLDFSTNQTLKISKNLIINVGNVVTQTVTGASGVVSANSSGNVITLVNTNGIFDTKHYLFGNTANLKTVPTSTLNIFSGSGLENSSSEVALFIKGNI